jgi:hypothetical protein
LSSRKTLAQDHFLAPLSMSVADLRPRVPIPSSSRPATSGDSATLRNNNGARSTVAPRGASTASAFLIDVGRVIS